MDNLQWFKFSPSDWMMGRIQRQPAQVQVDFIRVCCKYWQKDGILSIEDAEMEACDSYPTLVKFKLIREVEGLVSVNFLDEQLEGLSAKREQASQAGKRSAERRKRLAESNDRSTTVQPPLDSVEQNPTEKSRVDESTEENRRKKEKVVADPTHPLTIWINENAPSVEGMRQPLTDQQAEKLVAELGITTKVHGDKLREVISDMENKPDLLKKYKSANLTIRKWWANAQKWEGIANTPPTEKVKMRTETYNR